LVICRERRLILTHACETAKVGFLILVQNADYISAAVKHRKVAITICNIRNFKIFTQIGHA